MLLKAAVLLLFFTLGGSLAPPVQAQTAAVNAGPAELKIRVLEKGSGQPLRRVEVRVGEQILYTDPQGEAKLPDLKGAKVLFAKAGYERQIIDLANLRQEPTIYLWPDAPDDNEVIIKGSKRRETAKKTISARETQRIAPGGDPVQITKILPGVQSQGFQQQLIIRGSGPQDSRYFVDDLRVLNIFHNIGNISIIPDLVVDQVDFSSGGFGAQYGNATGGVVVLRTTTEVPDHAITEARLNVPFLTTFYHERPLSEESSLVVSYRHSLTEFLVPKIIERLNEDDENIYAVPKFSDAHVRYLNLTEDGSYKLSLIASHDGIEAVFPNDEFTDESGKVEIEFDNYFGVIGLERRLRLGEGRSLRSTPQIYRSRQDADFGPYDVNIDFTEYSAPTEFEQRLGKRRYLYVGFNPIYGVTDLDVSAPNINPEDPFDDFETAETLSSERTYRISNYSSWLSLDFEWGDFTLIPGLHYYHSGFIEEGVLDPRMSIFYRLMPGLHVKATVGQYSMEPEAAEASDDFGNPELGFEKANHYIVGLGGKWGDRWEYDLQYFEKKVYRLVRSHPTLRYNDTGTLRVKGYELFLRRNMTEKTFGWLSYTYSKAEERKTDALPFHTSPYDQSHILHLALAYKFTAQWELGTRIKAASGTPYTPVTGSYYDANTDKFIPNYDEANPYSKKFPAYDQSDLFASYESFYDTWTLTQRFGLQFISIKKPVSGIDYSYDYGQKEFSSTSLPPIPYYEIKGRF